MSLWKILLSLALGIVLSLGVAACGGGGGDDDDDTANDDDVVPACDLCTADQTCVNDVCVDADPCAACTAEQTCVDDVCVTAGPGDAVNADDLVGKTFAFMCILDGNVTQPPGLGPVLKGLVQCEDIPPIGLTILSVEGDTLTLVGASLIADGEDNAHFDEAESVVLAMPPADFTGNPLLEMAVDGVITIAIEGIELKIDNLVITGVVASDLSQISEGTFGGGIDPTPLEGLLGSDPCMLIPGICDETTGFINLYVEELLAIAVDTQIPPAPAQ